MRNKFSFAVLSLALCLGACSKYDDTEIRKRADRLEQKISVVENNINSLRTLLEAQKSNAYIKSIIAFTEGNGGYDITLSNGKSIKVYNGANGKDGKNGENGRDGIDGKNGKDGKNGENGRDGRDGENGKDGKDGKNGENGRDGIDGKNGKDGKNGENGRDGRDGIDGKNGENGRDGRDGVDGKNGKDAVASANPISSVDTSNSEYVVFNLRDGGAIRIPRNASMRFSFDNAEDFAVFAGKKYEIPYTCSALSGKSTLKVIAQDGYKAKLSRKSDTKGIIELTVPSPAVDTEIIVLLSDGEGATKIYSMSIFAGTLSISSDSYLAEKDGATITVPVTTNINYSIEIAKDAQSWISHTATNLRALNTRNENIEFRVKPNPNKYPRYATIKIKNRDKVLKSFTITQMGESRRYEATPGDLETLLNGNFPYRLKLSGKLIKKDFDFLRANSREIEILDLSDLDMTELPDSVFMNSKFEEVILPNKLIKIPNYCFGSSPFSYYKNYTEIKNISIPSSVTSIGDFAFYYCTNLSSLSIGNSVTSIGDFAFSGCKNLSGELSIPNSVTSIGSEAFSDCTNLSSLSIGNSVTSIGSDAFSRCTNLSSLSIGNSVTRIGSSAFSGCKNLSGELRIPNSVTRIGSSAFSGCKNLSSLSIGNSVTSIGGFAFLDCYNLSGELRIPNSVTEIGDFAFYGCTNLSGVLRIPNSMTRIDEYAFQNCKGFSSLIIEGTPYIGRSAFLSNSNESLPMANKLYSKSNNPRYIASNVFWAGEQYSAKPKTLYVPKGAKVAYEKLQKWNVFQEIIEIEDSQFP